LAKTNLVSNFHVAKRAGTNAIEELIREATGEMHDKAQLRLQQQAGQRDYELDPGDIEKEVSDRDGKISYGPFYGRFFEFGTVSIQAMPFIRPGHRAGRKHVRTKAPDVFDRWMRKARI
jgi:hypothetical protein